MSSKNARSKDKEAHDDTEKLWKSVLGALEVQIENPSHFQTFLADSQATRADAETLLITVRNGFVAEWIRQRMINCISRAVQTVFGHRLRIQFETKSQASAQSNPSLYEDSMMRDLQTWENTTSERRRTSLAKQIARLFPLRSNLTFERFQESQSNRIALKSALAVAEAPGETYNPLSVFAETGQGKTHLLQATAHRLRQQGKNTMYIAAEQFINDFVTASQNNKISAMRKRYFSLDALIVDGIEKLIDKKETQRFFAEIIDRLISSDMQVIIAGNSGYPLHHLAPEISSRLSGGLEVFIDPPDQELKSSLLQQYSNDHEIRLLPEAIDIFAKRSVRNARELIGGIARAAAQVTLTRTASDESTPTVTRAIAADAVRDRLVAPSPTLLSPKDVITAVEKTFQLEKHSLTRPGRSGRKISDARDVATYLMREKCGLTSSQTGDILGGRAHSSIIAALQRYTQRREQDPSLIRAEQEAQRLITQPSSTHRT